MGGATVLLVVAVGFGLAGEFQVAGIALVVALTFGAIEYVAWGGDPDSPPRFRDRHAVSDVRPLDEAEHECRASDYEQRMERSVYRDDGG